jgi:hypothetical protein
MAESKVSRHEVLGATPADTITVALYLARKTAKAEMQRQGIKPYYVEAAVVAKAAKLWLREQPELIAEAQARLSR